MNIEEIRKNAPDGAMFYAEIHPRVHCFKKIGNTFYIQDKNMWISLCPQDKWIESKIKTLN